MKNQRGFIGVIAVFWLIAMLGWILNVVQVFKLMPATFGEATPLWVVKAVCIFVPGLGSVMGYVGLFQ